MLRAWTAISPPRPVPTVPVASPLVKIEPLLLVKLMEPPLPVEIKAVIPEAMLDVRISLFAINLTLPPFPVVLRTISSPLKTPAALVSIDPPD